MHRMAVTLFLILSVVHVVIANDVGGVINAYASVRSINVCRNRLQVDDASDFSRGDTVILIQMQGALVNDTGVVTDYGACGRFERNVIDAIVGDAIVLRYRMLADYDPAGVVQLVRMPSYATARVTSTLSCAPWNGATGGVLAMSVRDTLWLQRDVDVTGKGFRGAADRGEGIARVGPSDPSQASANGGGMVIGSRRSASGGAHHGCGGTGVMPMPRRGGGHAIPYDAGSNWLMMGGAGGASRADDATVLFGGNGGGIVIMDVPVMIGNDSAVVRANGADGNGRDRYDGSGGGAGGVLLITARVLRRIPSLDVHGGDGGIAVDDDRRGGAGGGGGTIRLGTITALNLNPSSYAGGVGRHAYRLATGDPGCDGRVYYNITINDAREPFAPKLLSVSADTQICKGASVLLWAERPVRWTDGVQSLCDSCDTVRVTPSVSTTFRAMATYADGCADTSIVQVRVVEAPACVLAEPPPMCIGAATTLTAPEGFTAYRWSTADTTRTIVVREAGTYELLVIDSNGCSTTATVTVRHTTETGATLTMGGADLLDIMAGERRCADVTITNITDTAVRITSAWCVRNEVLGVPPSQFPIDVPARAQRALRVCASADVPGDHVDTLACVAGCGIATMPLVSRVLETPAWSRCRVLVLGAGERTEFLPLDVQVEAGLVVVDVQGRIVLQRRAMADVEHLDLAAGVYVVRAVTPLRMIDRVVVVP